MTEKLWTVWMGQSVKVDPTIAPNELQFRNDEGRVIGRIMNIEAPFAPSALTAAREAVIQAAKEWEAARSCTVTDAVGLLPDIFPPIDALSAAVRALTALEVSPAPEKSP